MTMTGRFLSLLVTILMCSAVNAQEYTLRGYVRAAESNEELFNASIFLTEHPTMGTSTNEYGFYSLSLPAGKYSVSVAYIGYKTETYDIEINKDTFLNFFLDRGIKMSEVVVVSEKGNENVNSTQMGTVNLKSEVIKKLPALFGEVNVLKTLQLLPGVLSSGSGSSGFVVRGGNPSQNLILMDEAVVYNPGHLLGFFSVFNADIIKDVTLIKGSMPARYGGRLSSVVDIHTREGNSNHYAATGGIGLISSNLTIEGPIVQDKSAFILSGRRTYLMDLIQPFLEGKNYEGTNYYFYDLNAKVNYKFSDKNRLYLSGYYGRDIFKFVSHDNGLTFSFPYGNSLLSLRWNHLFSPKLFMNVTAVYNKYKYEFKGGLKEFTIKSSSYVRDMGVKFRWEYFPSVRHDITYGLDILHHTLTPTLISGETQDVSFNNNLPTKYGASIAAYFTDDWEVSPRFQVVLGLRLSLFTQLGPYEMGDNKYGALEPIISYVDPQPRLSMRYKIDETSSIKGGLGYTVQYLHRVSNSSSTLPIDIWVPSTRRVKPQRNLQYSIGYFKNLFSDAYQFSTELYYRDLNNQIDYRDDYVASATREVENAYVFGTGRAYGMEVFLKKSTGNLTGWISYTLSRSERSFPLIEDGRIFPSTYDKKHDLSVVINYEFSPQLSLSSTFVYGSGRWYTPIEGMYFIENELHLFYGTRNSARLEDYHRLDLSLSYTPSGNKDQKWKSSWNFSVYNVYNRKNPFFIYTDTSVDDASGDISVNSTKVTIFPIIPSISWSFKWNQE